MSFLPKIIGGLELISTIHSKPQATEVTGIDVSDISEGVCVGDLFLWISNKLHVPVLRGLDAASIQIDHRASMTTLSPSFHSPLLLYQSELHFRYSIGEFYRLSKDTDIKRTLGLIDYMRDNHRFFGLWLLGKYSHVIGIEMQTRQEPQRYAIHNIAAKPVELVTENKDVFEGRLKMTLLTYFGTWEADCIRYRLLIYDKFSSAEKFKKRFCCCS